MKKMINFLYLISILLIDCRTSNDKNENTYDKRIVKDTIASDNNLSVNAQNVDDTMRMLQGVWAESEEENANFYIKNDTIIFTEHQDWISRFKIRTDTFIGYFYAGGEGSYIVKYIIKKLNNDSLILQSPYDSTITKMHKRK